MNQQNIPFTLQCHRCMKLFQASTNEFGFQEHLSIRFRADGSSSFKRFALYELHLCPKCVKKVLYKYFTYYDSLMFRIQYMLENNPDLDSDCK